MAVGNKKVTVREQYAFGKKYRKTNKEQVHKVHDDEFFNSLVLKCKFND